MARTAAERPSSFTVQTGSAGSEPLDPLVVHLDAQAETQFGSDTRGPVTAAGIGVDLPDQFKQLPVPGFPSRFGPSIPLVIS